MQTILETKKDLYWAPPGSEIYIIKDDQFPPLELTVTAHVLCFEGDRILMAFHRERGWDIPGGHIEPGESPESAIIRETYEETAAWIKNIRVIGHMKLMTSRPKPEGWKYPYPEGYLLFFYADFLKFDSFKMNSETIERKFFSPEEAENVPWIREYKTLYQLGMDEIVKR